MPHEPEPLQSDASNRRGVLPWATLRLRLAAGPRAPELLATQAELLTAIGTLLAEDPDVGGAETRDPTTLGGATRPELWIYTIPDALPRLRERARELSEAFALRVDIAAEVRHDDDWRDAWKQFYRPQRFGQDDLLVRPSWIARTPDDPAREIVIDPGRAFGTGLHESTRLCLVALCELSRRDRAPARILDLGCGSGILALAAARLWPHARVVAVDNDPEATDTTRENAGLNALGDRLAVLTGELSDLPTDDPFDLLVANIRADVLTRLAASARAYLRDGATVLLSGVLAPERASVTAAWQAAGFVAFDQNAASREDGEWCAISLRASAMPS